MTILRILSIATPIAIISFMAGRHSSSQIRPTHQDRIPTEAKEHKNTSQSNPSAAPDILAPLQHRNRRVTIPESSDWNGEEGQLSASLSLDELDTLVAELGPAWIEPIPDHVTGVGETIAGVPHGEWSLMYPASGNMDSGKYILGSRFGEWTLTNLRGEAVQRRTYQAGVLQGLYWFRETGDDAWMSVRYENGQAVEQ